MSLGVIFTYLMTFGGSCISLFNPFVGLLIYISFAIIRPASTWGYALNSSIPYSRIVAIALLVGWILHGCGNWKLGRGRVIITVFFAYWVWAIVCAIFAPNQPVAWGFVENTAKILLPLLAGVSLIDSL